MAGPIFSARICQGASGTTAAEAGYGVCGLAWTHTQAAEARESCVDRDVLGTLHANTLHEIPLNHDGRGGGNSQCTQISRRENCCRQYLGIKDAPLRLIPFLCFFLFLFS